jgi:hypothetical protein
MNALLKISRKILFLSIIISNKHQFLYLFNSFNCFINKLYYKKKKKEYLIIL